MVSLTFKKIQYSIFLSGFCSVVFCFNLKTWKGEKEAWTILTGRFTKKFDTFLYFMLISFGSATDGGKEIRQNIIGFTWSDQSGYSGWKDQKLSEKIMFQFIAFNFGFLLKCFEYFSASTRKKVRVLVEIIKIFISKEVTEDQNFKHIAKLLI